VLSFAVRWLSVLQSVPQHPFYTSFAVGQTAVAPLLLQMNGNLLGKKRHINDVSLRFRSN